MKIKLTPVFFFLVTVLTSCGMPATRLGDNTTRIPKNTSVYKHRVKFNVEILRYIDTSVVYEEIGYIDRLNKDSLGALDRSVVTSIVHFIGIIQMGL
jgi:hypothetical protein